MRNHGKITHWNHQKGYGFITPASGDNVFVHIRAFANRDHQPEVNQRVTYDLSTDRQDRPCAARVALLGEETPERFRRNDKLLYMLGAVAFLSAVGIAVAAGALPLAVLLVYLGASALTFVIYALDKSSAERGGWRTKESTLHLLGLMGGWPGAVIAQQVFRHKSSKKEFRSVFSLTVIVNCAALAWLFTDSGRALLNALLSGL